MARKHTQGPSGAEWAVLGRICSWLADNGLNVTDADEFAWTYIWMIILRDRVQRMRRALMMLAAAVAVMAAAMVMQIW